MNTNWDEIRGKAEREQNVPTKTFTHDGTQYALTGDHQRAHSHFHEARAHLGKMKMINVNNLPIISGIKYFDDGSVATFKVVHGKEDIHIVSPMAQLGGEIPPVPKKGIEEIEQIVPVIRSVDNLHWVACMSGTFEGPYYHFPNTFEIPEEAFDDNAEVDLNRQLISIGISPIEDSIEPPELYFIAQTGVRPEGDEYELVPDSSASSDLSHTGNTVQVCGDVGLTDTSGTGHEFSSASEKINVFGQTLSIPESNTSTTVTRSRTWITCSAGIEDVYSVCAEDLATPYLPPAYEFFAQPHESYSEGDSRHITSSSLDYFPWSGNESVRPERGNIENFAACYRHTTRNIENLGAREYDPCAVSAVDYVYDIIDTDTETFCDYFKVDEVEYPLRGESDSTYPRFLQKGLKYYNTDSIAATTAITAALAKYLLDGVEDSWPYYYVGPNSRDDLTRTLFIPEPGAFGPDGHIIPNVEGLDDTVLFKGEIFLGLVKYEIEV